MKRQVFLTLLTAGLTLLPFASIHAWETSFGVDALPITSLAPFRITTAGRYYLRGPLDTGATTGAAIEVRADDVVLDLNGATLSASALNNSAVGVLVTGGRHNVTIQNGTIDGFGGAGILISEGGAQNVVDNVHMDNNGIGIHVINSSFNLVKNCLIEGGSTGILFTAGSGNRASYNTLGNQSQPALLTEGSSQNYFDNNLVAKGGSPFGQVMAGPTDKYRFETFVGFGGGSPSSGGTNEMANSL